MKIMRTRGTRGMVFSLDAAVAVLILLLIVPLTYMLTLQSGEQQSIHYALKQQAQDVIEVMSKVTIEELSSEPTVSTLLSQGVLNETDYNKTLFDVLGAWWAENTDQSLERAYNLTKGLFEEMLPSNLKWEFVVGDRTIYNTSVPDPRYALVASKRMISGYSESLPSTGYMARAFLTRIVGKSTASYVYFGGFVGEGNLTHVMRDIPENATIKTIYMEFSLSDNFNFYINGNQCGSTYTPTAGNLSADSWTITDQTCLDYISPGQNNTFKINFTTTDISGQYVGGGFIKVVYDTNQFAPNITNNVVYHFPGIRGVINLYSGFYVPGNLTSVNGYLHFYNPYNTSLAIGNVTIFNSTGDPNYDQHIYIPNDNFSALLNYTQLSLETFPIRMHVPDVNITGGKLNGTADVILITDVSGSMDWRVGYTSGTGVVRSCDSPNLFDDDTQRLALAKCLDKDFIDDLLELEGNRVGLVAFSADANNYMDLTDNATTLKAEVDTYVAGGGTCISCAINQAYNMLMAQSNDTRKKYIVAMTDGIPGYRSSTADGCEPWATASSPTSESLSSVTYTDSATGFAVGANGKIVKWTGSWASDTSPTSNNLRGVATVNSSLAFAVGDSGTILKWDGTWDNDTSPTGNHLYGAHFYSASLGFAVGDTGTILKWNGTWDNDTSPTSSTLRSVWVHNSSLAFAVGDTGTILKWNGSWSTVTSPTSSNLHGVSVTFFNYTRAYAVGDSGRIVAWNDTADAWRTEASPTTTRLRSVFVNDTLGYAVGDSGRIIKWYGNEWVLDRTPVSNYLYGVSYWNWTKGSAVGSSGRIIGFSSYCVGTATSGASCGSWPTYCSGNTEDCPDWTGCAGPSHNSVFSACRAFDHMINLTIDSIGFGPIGDCGIANITLRGVANCGNGSYYTSANATELQNIYRQIADDIVVRTTITQILNISGAAFNITLYPDSYLSFDYEADPITFDYQEILITVETGPLGGCEGGFNVSANLTVIDSRVTSYSGEYWTDNVSVRSSSTGNVYQNVFWLAHYGQNYTSLGDPFAVNFPPELITPGETNFINVKLGYTPTNSTPQCSANNRVIYKAKLRAAVPYTGLFPKYEGTNETVFFEDGTNTTIVFGNSTDPWDPTGDALDDALQRLFDLLDFDGDGLLDVKIDSDSLQIDNIYMSGLPYMWGPVDMVVRAWA